MRSARVLDGDSSTTMPSSGKTSASTAWTLVGLSGSDSATSSGRRALRWRIAGSTSPSSASSASSGERDVGDDRVAHRRARRLVRVAGDGHQLGALGQQRPGDVRVVREDRASRRRGSRSWPASSSPRGPIAGGRTPWKAGWPSGKPIRPPPGAGVAQTGSRWRSASVDRCVPGAGGVDVGPDDQQRARGRLQPAASSRTALGVGGRATVTVRPIWCGTASASTSAPSRPSGSRRTPALAAAGRRGARRAPARAGRPRRAAARSSTSRAGGASASRRGW